MNRRDLFRNLMFISTGVSIIPSCLLEEKKSALALKNLHINPEQQAFLDDLTETIIPQTSSPGAKALGSYLFVLMMVDECKTSKEQETFVNGLNQMMALARNRTGGSFEKASALQKSSLLDDIEKKKNMPDEVVAFYSMTKRLTIQSFTSSEYFLTKIQVYDMIPGRWHGCFPLKNDNVHG